MSDYCKSDRTGRIEPQQTEAGWVLVEECTDGVRRRVGLPNYMSQEEAVLDRDRLLEECADIDDLAAEHEESCYEDDGEAAYGRED